MGCLSPEVCLEDCSEGRGGYAVDGLRYRLLVGSGWVGCVNPDLFLAILRVLATSVDA